MTPCFSQNLNRCPGAELRQLQLQRLKATLDRITSHNPFYAEKLNGLSSRDITALEDIQKFPFMTKDDLRVRLSV